jgi:4-carboxymuconolactone decarboxylase
MRIAKLDRAEMNEEQKRVFDHAKATGGIQGGPYHAYIHVPKLFEVSQAMRNAMVPEPLGRRERQYVNLAVARHWGARYPWHAQVRGSLELGISKDEIDAINAGRTPKIADARERTSYEVSVEMLSTKSLSEKTYKAAEQTMGLQALVGLVGAIGSFTMTCLTANAFGLEPPAEDPIPLKQ